MLPEKSTLQLLKIANGTHIIPIIQLDYNWIAMPFFFPRGKETLFEAISGIRKQNKEMDQLEPLVNTACRIRAADKTEKREKRVLQVKPAMRLKNQKIRCDFDDVNNEEAFQKRVCDQVLEGQNTTLIAYG